MISGALKIHIHILSMIKYGYEMFEDIQCDLVKKHVN
jgi:hypothetical protein